MLHDMQNYFVNAIFDGAEGSPIHDFIGEQNNRSIEAQIAIYRGSIFGGLIKALAETYPVCKKLVGEKFFDTMVCHFLKKFPSLSPDLNDYGVELADFIESFSPAASLPYLADVARLEWAWNIAFSGADTTAGDFFRLAELTPEQQLAIRFLLPEDSTLLAFEYPIYRIWQVNQDDYEGDGEVDLDDGACHLLIWRYEFSMRIDVLDEPQWLFLRRVREGNLFSTICEDLICKYGNVDIGNLLSTSIQKGWVTGFSMDNT